MLRAILNKSWKQHPTKLQLYGHLPPIMKTIQVKRTRQCRGPIYPRYFLRYFGQFGCVLCYINICALFNAFPKGPALLKSYHQIV